MALLRKNTPEYFHPEEEIELLSYLEKEVEDYYVFECNAEIVGAGGINYFPEENLARISWDMIDPEWQGKGIGRKLTQYRIEQLRQQQQVEAVVVRTTQLVFTFYEKMGFVLEKIEKDFWADGFDLYEMKMDNLPLC